MLKKTNNELSSFDVKAKYNERINEKKEEAKEWAGKYEETLREWGEAEESGFADRAEHLGQKAIEYSQNMQEAQNDVDDLEEEKKLVLDQIRIKEDAENKSIYNGFSIRQLNKYIKKAQKQKAKKAEETFVRKRMIEDYKRFGKDSSESTKEKLSAQDKKKLLADYSKLNSASHKSGSVITDSESFNERLEKLRRQQIGEENK